MKVVVTGGAGFIGSHVVDAFFSRGDDVVIIDHWKKEKKRFVPGGVRVIKAEIASPEACAFISEYKPDIVCHLAAQISAPHSVEDPAGDAQTNIVDAIILLEACAKASVSTFLYTSSCAVYGRSPDLPLAEESPRIPESPYALSKAAFETYVAYAHERYGMRTVAFRPANVYGPRQQVVGEAGVVAIFLDRLFAGKKSAIYGDGRATRDFVYVEDIAHAFVLATNSQYQGVLNLGTGLEKSVQELWDALHVLHGGVGSVEYVEPRKGDILRSFLDASKAKREIGWEPSISFEEGLKKTYNWFTDRSI